MLFAELQEASDAHMQRPTRSRHVAWRTQKSSGCARGPSLCGNTERRVQLEVLQIRFELLAALDCDCCRIGFQTSNASALSGLFVEHSGKKTAVQDGRRIFRELVSSGIGVGGQYKATDSTQIKSKKQGMQLERLRGRAAQEFATYKTHRIVKYLSIIMHNLNQQHT